MRIVCLALVAAIAQADPPSINPSGIVNAATGQTAVAPYSIATLYGANLYLDGTANANAAAELPATLAGMTVQIGGTPAGLIYIAADQLNLLIPNSIGPGTYPVMVVRNGIASLSQPITIQPYAPGIFAATHADASPVTSDSPASPGEIVILYATGLGPTLPNPPDRSIAPAAAPITQLANFQILLDGTPIDPSSTQYAGLAPFNAGLYQINLQLPQNLPPTNPQIVLSVAGIQSQSSFTLYCNGKRVSELPPSQGNTPPVM